MEQIILILHVLLALALIGLVLLQKGKGASMGVAFGSGASQTVFGSRGSIGFLMKLTIGTATLFFATSIALTYIAGHSVKKTTTANDVLTRVEKVSVEHKKAHKRQGNNVIKPEETTVKK
jgi:preprotein translocase subunit SecG